MKIYSSMWFIYENESTFFRRKFVSVAAAIRNRWPQRPMS
jgi:hypothetical protein